MTLIGFSRFMKKFLPYMVAVDIGIAIIVGKFYPGLGKALKPYTIIPIFLMLIPMMISANVGGILRVFKNPKLVISAVILNFIISPPLGKLLASAFYHHQPVLLPVGYILNMVTPCSDMVIAWTGFAGGSIEVATAIVALSLVSAIGFIPVWMWLLTHTWVHVPIGIIFKSLVIVVIIPLILGYGIRIWMLKKMGEKRFLQIKPSFPAISSIGMYMIVFIAMTIVAQSIIKHPMYIIIVAVSMGVYYLLLFGIAVGWSKIGRFKYGEMVALSYSVTAKNLSITIAIAIVTWGGLAVLVPAFDPVIQVPIMILILTLTQKLKKHFDSSELVRMDV
ncbi:MAG: hypothetical protein B5M53_00040 [Candidatus Cloacimonas sp. 4484_209]|nr:MAG: hypothetical protein B5M53_00040 [Candidatus Cloacimonas sp. 4484_209]